MSRAFRARPLDVNRQLELILDINELDSAEGLPARDVVHNHAALDADNEKVRASVGLLGAAACCWVLRAVGGLAELAWVCSTQPGCRCTEQTPSVHRPSILGRCLVCLSACAQVPVCVQHAQQQQRQQPCTCTAGS